MNSLIKVVDRINEDILKTFPITEAEAAHAYAVEMESYGLDIKIITPTITETLSDSLGLSHDQKMELEQSVTAEIEDHDGGCCVGPNGKPI